MQYTIIRLLFVILFVGSFNSVTILEGHGFAVDTQICLCDEQNTVYLSDICWRTVRGWKQWCIASYDEKSTTVTHGVVVRGAASVAPSYVRLTYGNEDRKYTEAVICTPLQDFYLYDTKEWIPAYKLEPGTRLQSVVGFQHVVVLEHIIEPRDVYLIEVQDTHTFFVGRHGLLTHNMSLPWAFSVGMSVPFGAVAGGATGSCFGPVTMLAGAAAGFAIGLGIKIACGDSIPTYEMAAYDARKSGFNKLSNMSSAQSSMGGNGGPNRNQDDDEEEEDDEPFGKYADAPYHHPNSKGNKSVCPDNGQDALNHSIPSPNKNSRRRYGVSSRGQFVVFDQTSPGLYHGHVAGWDELIEVQGLRRKMVEQGLATNKGKAIIRPIKKIIKGS